MNTQDILKLCLEHGYRSIPTSERVLLDALDLEKNDISSDQILELGKLIEFREKSPRLFVNQKDQIEVSDVDTLKGPNVSLYSDNVELIEKFRALCYINLSKDLGWFHQCNSEQYQMFEFWKPQTDAMVAISLAIATELRLPFLNTLENAYRPGVVVEAVKLKSLTDDMPYQTGNFH